MTIETVIIVFKLNLAVEEVKKIWLKGFKQIFEFSSYFSNDKKNKS